MALARLLSVLSIFAFIALAWANNNVLRCATDANVKTPLSGPIAYSRDDYAPQLSGFIIRVPWSQINPQPGVYYFTPLDEQLQYAEDNDAYNFKGIVIEITAGDNTPGWLLERTTSGNLVAPFWKPTYLQAYRDLMTRAASRYDGQRLVRGIYLTACTPNAASAAALDASGYLKLAADQCYYSAMMTHVSLWTNTPSILSLPYSMDDTWQQIAHDFRVYLGPRLGVLAITQQLSAPINVQNFDLLKTYAGANLVILLGNLQSPKTIDEYFDRIANSKILSFTMPTKWNVVGANFIEQFQLDALRSRLATPPMDCAFAPGRGVITSTQATVPSQNFFLQVALSPDGSTTRDKILAGIASITGLPSARFTVAPPAIFGNVLNVHVYIYDAPYSIPAYLVGDFLEKVTAPQWRTVGLEARSGKSDTYGTQGSDEMDGVTIFLIVLAAVIYLVVFVLFCYLMFVVVRYCTQDRHAAMATISSAGNRIRGWVRFNDEDSGFPSTTPKSTPPPTATAV